MSQWQNSTRRERLPANWSKIRKRIMKRDRGMCQVTMADGEKCLDLASEVDHKQAGDDHDDLNLQAICSWHHQRKSSQEGGQAAAVRRQATRNKYVRTEAHPGLV